MGIAYEKDIVAWANEQASFIRAGRFDLLDIEHLAEEIEDVGKSEKRELASRMALLLSHLLKWQFQSGSVVQAGKEPSKNKEKRLLLKLKARQVLKFH